jgi:hypothetical protein
VHLGIEQDLYVQDHDYGGALLFPTVFGLEAMGQVALYVTGEREFRILRIEEISLQRPIIVNPEKGTHIEIHAEVQEREAGDSAKQIRVGIKTEQTGFAINHFAATYVLHPNTDAPERHIELPEIPLDILPKQDLYGMFKRPIFFGIAPQAYYVGAGLHGRLIY